MLRFRPCLAPSGASLLSRLPSRLVHHAPTCPYAVLGISRQASQREVKQRYLQLAKQHHPDTGAGDADATLFARVSAAYELLSDPARRAELDVDPAEEARAAAAAALELLRAGGSAVIALQMLGKATEVMRAKPEATVCAAASVALEAAAKGRGDCPAVVTFTLARGLWAALCDAGAVDARACNAYFGIALRAGELSAATGAFRHAERAGLRQSVQMQAYVQQARRYAAKRQQGTPGASNTGSKAQASTRDGSGGGDGDGPPKQPLR